MSSMALSSTSERLLASASSKMSSMTKTLAEGMCVSSVALMSCAVAQTTRTSQPVSRPTSSIKKTLAGSQTARVRRLRTLKSGRTACFSRNSRLSVSMTLASATRGEMRAYGTP